MHAVLNGDDGHLHWTEVPNPQIKEDEVLLEVHAAALNRADLLQRAGQYPPPPGWPDWFGLEAAGVITAVGKQVEEEGKWHVGDKVCALLGSGGYAEYVAVPEGMLMPIPNGLSMGEAAALPEAYGAAYLFLFMEGGLKAGDTLLVQAGASGLASVLIPMAKAFGARVITTVLNDEQEKAIEHLKADIVVNSSREVLVDVMKREMEGGRPVDITVDCLGGDTVGKCMPYMNYDGRWIMIATLAGDPTIVDLRNMYVRRTRIIGTNLRSRTPAQKKKLLSDMVDWIWPKVESGEVRPTIFKVYPIEQAEEAQDLMQSGKSAGKIVLTVKADAFDNI
ncbi:MAG: NAD(P)H-quinone oxidoreductase [Lachnospiraceae bacterium]|nr:NAD(P)H-quinone oxidoreductase [Lachnospiraceae bacterium]